MATKKKPNPFMAGVDSLGAGVNLLFEDDKDNNDKFLLLLIDNIIVEEQIRKEFEDEENTLEDLAASIKKEGVLEPLVVREEGTNYILVFGERRLRAAKIAGLPKVPVIVKPYDHEQAAAVQFAENIHRKNLTLMEQAAVIQNRIDAKAGKKGGKKEVLAEVLKEINKNKFWASRMLSLLKLPEHSTRLAETNITKDLNVIQQVKRIEAVDPDSAKVLVDELIALKSQEKENAGKNFKVNVRNIVEKASTLVKAKPNKKTDITVSLPIAAEDGSISADIYLENVYTRIIEHDIPVETVLKDLVDTANDAIVERLKEHYSLGRSSKKPTKYILSGLKKRTLSYVDFRVFYLAAFLHGVCHRDFNLNDILNEATD